MRQHGARATAITAGLLAASVAGALVTIAGLLWRIRSRLEDLDAVLRRIAGGAAVIDPGVRGVNDALGELEDALAGR
ncbi:MAG: hypothetical protein M3N57_06755 [Actinomycetota bacterium]|nr:hypothetical protein [Actinomycetota bacterium]